MSTEIEHVYVTAPRIYLTNFAGFLYDYTNPTLGFITGYGGNFIPLVAVATDDSGNITIRTKEGCKQSFDPGEYTTYQQGLLLKLVNEGSDDPKIKALYEYCAANNIEITYHNDGYLHDKNGFAFEWDSVPGTNTDNTYGAMSTHYTGDGKPAPGATIHISTNQNAIDAAVIDGWESETGLHFLADILVHELAHAWINDTNTSGDEEVIAGLIKPAMVDNVFKNDDGSWEDDWAEVYQSGKAIGTFGNDIITGGSEGYNMLEGGAGNDVVTGGSKNDYIDGGAGSDKLYGLGGDDILIAGTTTGIEELLNGGTGNDNYIIDSYAQARTISDSQGIDTLHLETDTSAIYFHRLDNDDMVVIGGQTSNIVIIKDWSTTGQIENIIFSDDSTNSYQQVNNLAIDESSLPSYLWI